MKTFIALDIAIRHHTPHADTWLLLRKNSIDGETRYRTHAREREREKKTIRLFVKTLPYGPHGCKYSLPLYDLFFEFFSSCKCVRDCLRDTRKQKKNNSRKRNTSSETYFSDISPWYLVDVIRRREKKSTDGPVPLHLSLLPSREIDLFIVKLLRHVF